MLAAIGVVPVGVCGPSDDRCDLTTNEAHSPRDPDGRVQHRTIADRAIATGTGYARDDDEAHALIRTALGGAGGHHPKTGASMPCLVASGRNGRGSCCPVAGHGLPRSQACIGLPVYAAACRVRVGPGHWDVPDACAVLPEAWELVERGHVAVDDFKAFTHDNALALWGDEMFANTVIGAR